MSESPRFPNEPPPPVAYQPSLSSVRVQSANGMVSNKVKYRDTGAQPVRGRVGSGNVEARALLGTSGVTLVEVTTGSFDGGPDLSRIDKVLMKVVGSDAPPVNERPQNRYWMRAVQGLTTSNVIELSLHVRLASTAGVQVITLQVPVTMPPDLEVASLNGLSQAYVNTPVTLIATVRERNGSWGARANCLLTVDGVPTDQATGIWVDANGVVNCQFIHIFRTIGTHAVEVAATNVNPNDGDLTNNRASLSITVVPLGTPIGFGQLTLDDEAYTYRYETTRTGTYPINALSEGTQMRSQLWYGAQGALSVPAPLQRVEATMSVGGQTIYTSTLNELASYRYDDGFAVVTCTNYYTNGETADSCSLEYRDGTSRVTFNYYHSTGTVTYYSSSIICNLFGCNMYGPNSGQNVTGWGERYGLTLGSEVRVQLTFVDADGESWIADRNVTLADLSADVNNVSTGCRPYFDGLGDICWNNVESGTFWRGITIW